MSGIIGSVGSKSGIIGVTEPDYEEGIFTASFYSVSGGTIPIHAEYNTGAYTKVGRLVTIQGFLLVSPAPSGTNTGDVYIEGLPFDAINFSVASDQADYCASSIYMSEAGSAVGSVGGFVSPGTNNLYLRESGGTGSGADLAAHLGDSTGIYFNATYISA